MKQKYSPSGNSYFLGKWLLIYQLSFNKKSIIQVAITLISYTKFVYIWPCLNSLSITLFWKQWVIYTKIPILMPCQRRNLVFLLYFTLYYVCSYICFYLPWRLLLLLVIIISCLLFLSSSCLSSSALLSFSQGFLQAPKFPTSSGGKLLRCHSCLRERVHYGEEGSAVTQPRMERRR